jgi:hypothetical protein
VLYSVVIVRKRTASIIRRINKHALHLPCELLFERLQCEKIVPENKPVIKQVALRHTVLGVMGFGVVGDEDTRFQPRPVLFPDPSEFEFGFLDILNS